MKLLYDSLNDHFLKITSELSPKNIEFFRNKTALWLDECFFDLLKLQNIETLIECGAHEAYASVKFVKEIGRRAVAIEANPIIFKNITSKNNYENITFLNYGLGKYQGELNFYIPKNNKLAKNGSFLLKKNKNRENYFASKVKVISLDSLIDKFSYKDERFALWIDVEGYAHEVLQGGLKFLNSIKKECVFIKVEVEEDTIWDNQISDNKIINLLKDNNYVPILRDFEYENQYNILFIKKKYYNLLKKNIEYLYEDFKLVSLNKEEIDKSLFEKFRFIKKKITSLNNIYLLVMIHLFFTLCGSKSSYKFIKNKFFK